MPLNFIWIHLLLLLRVSWGYFLCEAQENRLNISNASIKSFDIIFNSTLHDLDMVTLILKPSHILDADCKFISSTSSSYSVSKESLPQSYNGIITSSSLSIESPIGYSSIIITNGKIEKGALSFLNGRSYSIQPNIINRNSNGYKLVQDPISAPDGIFSPYLNFVSKVFPAKSNFDHQFNLRPFIYPYSSAPENKIKTIELVVVNDPSRVEQIGNDEIEISTIYIYNLVQSLFDLTDFGGFYVKIKILAIISLNEPSAKSIPYVPNALLSPDPINPHDLLEQVSNWINSISPISFNFLSFFSFRKRATATNIPWLLNFDHLQLLSGRIWDISSNNNDNTNRHISSGGDLVEGLAFVRGMCQSKFSASIARTPGVDLKHGSSRLISQKYQAQIIAHELGHSLGASHDGLENACFPTGHIMQASAISIGRPLAMGWSRCSTEAISEYLHHPDSNCLDITNVPSSSLCGNGILDEGEECDSGSPTGSECCLPTCKLAKGSQCDDRNGRCCENCQLKKKGDICRQLSSIAEKSSCDQLDICDGFSSFCPDVWKPEGSECGLDVLNVNSGTIGVCDSGICFSRESICRRMGMEYKSECDPGNDCLIHCYDSASIQPLDKTFDPDIEEFKIIHSLKEKLSNFLFPLFQNRNQYTGYLTERCITFALSSIVPSASISIANLQLEPYKKASLFQIEGSPLILPNGIVCSNKSLKEPGKCLDGSCISRAQYEFELENVNNKQNELNYMEGDSSNHCNGQLSSLQIILKNSAEEEVYIVGRFY